MKLISREPVLGPMAIYVAAFSGALHGTWMFFGFSVWFWLFGILLYALLIRLPGELLAGHSDDTAIRGAQIVEEAAVIREQLNASGYHGGVVGREELSDPLGHTMIDVTPPRESGPHNGGSGHLSRVHGIGTIGPQTPRTPSQSQLRQLTRRR